MNIIFYDANMNYVKHVTNQLKIRRKKSGVSLPNLALRAGISKGNLSKIEKHASNLSVDTLGKLADAIGINPKRLFP